MRKGKNKAVSRFLTVKEAAEILTLSPKTVYRMVEKGELPGVNFGGAVRISRAEFEEYIARKLAQGLQAEDAPAPPPASKLDQTCHRQKRRGARKQPQRMECFPRD